MQRRAFPHRHGGAVPGDGWSAAVLRDEAAQRFGYRFRGVLSSARTGDHGVSALQDLRVLPAGRRGRAGDSRGKTLVRLAGVPLRAVRCGGPDFRRLWQWEAPGPGWRRCHVGELSASAGAAGRQV